MADLVRPLKYERPSTGGTETDTYQTEMDPLEDYVSAKGVSFEGLDTHLLEKIGGVILEKFPSISSKPIYLGNGDLNYVEYFNGFTQTTPNRIAKATLSYSGGLPTSEAIVIYDPADGTTILRTITNTFTFTGYDLTKVETSMS